MNENRRFSWLTDWSGGYENPSADEASSLNSSLKKGMWEKHSDTDSNSPFTI